MVIIRDRDAELLTTQSIRSHEPGEASRALDDACMHTNTRAPMRSMSFAFAVEQRSYSFCSAKFSMTGKVVDATRCHGRKRMNILIYSGDMGAGGLPDFCAFPGVQSKRSSGTADFAVKRRDLVLEL